MIRFNVARRVSYVLREILKDALRLNAFIRPRCSDWVVCVMWKYHSNQSKQFNRGIVYQCKHWTKFCPIKWTIFFKHQNVSMMFTIFSTASNYFDSGQRGIIKSWFFFLTLFSNFLLHIIQFYFKRFWGHLSYPIDLN